MTYISKRTVEPSPKACIPHFIAAQAERTPEAVAIAAPGRHPLTYGRLRTHVEYVVAKLNAMGIGRSDRVAVVLPNGPEMAAAFLTFASGATCAPLNPGYRASEFDFYLSDLEAKALIVQTGTDCPAIAVAQKHSIPIIELSPVVEGDAGTFSLKGKRQPSGAQGGFAQAEDVALILYTSGTTSRPKMVPLTHSNLLASSGNITATLQLTEQDRCLNVMPLFHIHGLVGAVFSSMTAGSSVVCTPGFDAEQFFPWLKQFRPTWYTAVPTMHRAVLSCAPPHRETLRRSPLRFIRSSSAPLPLRVMQELEEVFHVPVIEAYGMTEASHQIASNPLPPGTRKVRSVGLPTGAEVAVMDEEGNLVPSGQIGEIVIRGATIMPGYANSPEANGESFKDGWFRTGDQGYLDADSYLFITGRLHEAINRGGEKVSPVEVDEVLKEHPAVSEAVTFAVPHMTLGEDVAAAIVLHERASATEREIQEFAAARLADFKVPRLVLIVDEIPKSATGKLQRIGLADKLGLASTYEDARSAKKDFTAPRTPVEETLARVWSLVLGVDVGIHDNFLHLGGDSIHAARIISRIRASMRVELSFRAFFETPTVAAMATTIRTADQEPRSLKTLPLAKNETGPLSYAQEALWFLDQLDPGNPAYNRLLFIRLHGQLNLQALERSLHEIVHRHAVLRASFPAADGRPVQRICAAQPLSLSVTDISGLPEAEREAQARKVATEEARRPFDLARGPLHRASLLQLKEQLHLLLITIHHIVSDGWTSEVFLRELAILYEAFSAGRSSPLPELPIHYMDFARWQRESEQGEAMKNHLAYWRRQLDGGWPMLGLPTDHPRPPVQTFNGASRSFLLPKDLSKGLKDVSRQEGVSLFMTLLAAFMTLLYRYSGQEDIIVGTPFAGRNQINTEELMGLFINTLPLRTHLSGDPTFRELLARVCRTSLEAHVHQDIPFRKIMAELQLKRDISRTEVYQVLFQLRNYPRHVGQVGDLLMEKYEPETGTSLSDISLAIDQDKNSLECRFDYHTDLFEAATIARMGNHFQSLLEGIVGDPTQRLSELPLLTEDERHRLLVEWNDTERDYPRDKCVHELFEAQVKRSPDAVAASFEDKHLTYRELNRRANQLAHHLRKLGVGPEVLVGLCVERSLEMLVGLLAILKSGGAYVPMDSTYPKKRLAFMLEDSQATVLLTEQRLLDRLPESKAQTVCVDGEWEEIGQEAEWNPISKVTVQNSAYVIYTSGTTGSPKGVMVEHKSLVNYLCWFNESLLAKKLQSLPVITRPTFDASLKQLFAPLLQSGQVWILSDEVLNQPGALLKTLTTRTMVGLNCVPSFWKFTLDAIDSDQAIATETLSHLLLGGEQLNKQLVERTFAALPHIEIWNLYGPTEATANASAGRIAPHGAIILGRPIANTELYVLDGNLQATPIGMPGELYIGGAGLARGYLKHPDLTAEKFIPNPLSDKPGARLYKTGDVARYLPDGNIEFLGRIDHQVKIRGFRIELGEIETVLGQHPAVRDTVVLAREETPVDKRLVAYIVPGQAEAPAASDLREFLKERLPDYMIPSAFVFLDALPLTPNGKVDRRALPAPDQTRPELSVTFVAPRTPVEEVLAGIWADVLKLERVGIHDNFFELGGHSLLATQVMSRVRKAFEVDLPLRTLFEKPTIEEFAKVLTEYRTEKESDRLARMVSELEALSDEEAKQLLGGTTARP